MEIEEGIQMNPMAHFDVAMSIVREMTEAAELLHRRARVEADPIRDLPSYDDGLARLMSVPEPAESESITV